MAQRHTVLAVFTGALAAKAALRVDVKAALRVDVNAVRAADIAMAVLAPETYQLLVHERGWTTEMWSDWAADTLIRTVLPTVGSM
jgi:hypothetical protein